MDKVITQRVGCPYNASNKSVFIFPDCIQYLYLRYLTPPSSCHLSPQLTDLADIDLVFGLT